MLRLRRPRPLVIALAVAAPAAVAGTLAGTMSSGSAQVQVADGNAHTAAVIARIARKHTHANSSSPHVITRIVRGPQGPRGPKGDQGPQGPQGPQGAPATTDGIAVPITLNWFGDSNAVQYGTADPVTLPNIGTLTVECDENTQQITLVPASSSGTATIANVTTLQGEGTNGISSNQQDESYGATTPIAIPLPVNGMITGVFSVQPDYGAGGTGPSPVSFIFSSYMKLNGQDGSGDECTVAGQLVEHSS